MQRHRFDPLAFIFGLLFVAVAGVALIGADVLVLRDLTWIAPSLLVIAGAALLLSSARSGSDDTPDDTPEDTLGGQVRAEPRREQHPDDEHPDDEQPDGAPAREQARASDAPGMGPASGER